jgi:trehalose synthase
MLASIPIRPVSLQRYAPFLEEEELAEIQRLAAHLRGAKVIHINTTAFGTRVADMIGVMGGLMLDLGIDCRWQVLRVTSELVSIFQRIYDAAQDTYVTWDTEDALTWLEYSAQQASQFDGEYDYVIVHDPQTVPLLTQITASRGMRPGGTWLWHCHLDLGQANPEIRRFLATHASAYDAVLAEMESYLSGEDLPNPRVVLPAIDPLNPRNADLTLDTVPTLLTSLGLSLDRPLISQISNLEVAVDPMGALAAWRLAKQQVPDLQMIMAFPGILFGSATHNLFHQVVREIQTDADIRVLSPLDGVGNLEVNLLRQASSAVLQKSIGKGFGLVVAEAMWKRKPVVAGRHGGIPLQIVEGETGYLVDTVETCAQQLVFLAQNPDIAREMGSRGREVVRSRFLITRYLRDYLASLLSL